MLEAHMGGEVEIDLCKPCQAFWFDKFESLKLAPGATLQLMKMIGDAASAAKVAYSDSMKCPRCEASLLLTHDLQIGRAHV